MFYPATGISRRMDAESTVDPTDVTDDQVAGIRCESADRPPETLKLEGRADFFFRPAEVFACVQQLNGAAVTIRPYSRHVLVLFRSSAL
jgi:hypothetical protein